MTQCSWRPSSAARLGVGDIASIRLFQLSGEHEQFLDDVLGIIASGDATKLCWALCPLYKASVNCCDQVSQNNRSSKSMKVLVEGAKWLNFNQFCYRLINGPKKTESCASKFHTDSPPPAMTSVSIAGSTSLRKGLKIMQLKINLLHFCCPNPPRVVGAMSKIPFLGLTKLVFPSTMRPVTEVLPGHTTHLSGTFSRVTGYDEHRRNAVQLMKMKALYSAQSLAVLGLAGTCCVVDFAVVPAVRVPSRSIRPP